jgi:histidinol phosphatase-like PHP family hydrolase
MDKVIAAAVKKGIAIEINSRYKLPSATFIKRAKAAGAKFTLGVNNVGASDLGFAEYGILMIKECKLVPSDFWQATKKN